MGETTSKVQAGDLKPGDIVLYMGTQPHIVKSSDPTVFVLNDDSTVQGVRMRLAPEGGGRSVDLAVYANVDLAVRL